MEVMGWALRFGLMPSRASVMVRAGFRGGGEVDFEGAK